MILVPLFILVIAAASLWFTRNRPIRTQWGLSAAMALLSWIASLALRLSPDANLELSVWQPTQLFRSPLSLSIDPITWPIAYAVVTVLVAMVFTSASREMAPSVRVRVFWFLYAGAAYLAILADNMLTIVITWTLFDLVSAVFLFSFLRTESEIRQIFTRLSVDFIGVLLVLAGAAINISLGKGAGLAEPLESPLGVLLLGMAGFVRLGLLPLHFNLPGLMVTRRGIGTLLRYFPPAIVMAFLAKVFRAGVPEQTVPWFIAAGISGLFIGGIRWVLEPDPVAGRPFFTLTVSGIGVLAGSIFLESPMGIVSAAVVLLLAGAVLSLTEIFTPTHRIAALGAAAIQLGLPILPLGILFSNMGRHLTSDPSILVWIIPILLGVSLAALGSIHGYYSPERQWRTGENLVRTTYSLGIALPLLASIGIGLHFRPVINIWIWILSGVQLLLMAGGFVLLRNLSERDLGRWRISVSRVNPAGIYATVAGGLRLLGSGLRSLAELIEGEAAILWIFVVAIFMVLASS